MATYINKQGIDGCNETMVVVETPGVYTIDDSFIYYQSTTTPGVYNIMNSGTINTWLFYYSFYFGNFQMTFDTNTQSYIIKNMSSNATVYTTQTPTFNFNLVGGDNYKELVTPSLSYPPWPTKLKCNSSKSTLNVSYTSNSDYKLYCNGTYIATLTSEMALCGINFTSNYILKSMEVKPLTVIGTTTQTFQPYHVITNTGTKAQSVTANCSLWSFDTSYSASQSRQRQDINGPVCTGSFTAGGGGITLNCLCPDSSETYHSGGVSVSALPVNFHYQIEADTIPGGVLGTLLFEGSGLNWTGATSPNKHYKGSYSVSNNLTQKNNLGVILSQTQSPAYTTASPPGGTWTVTDPFPDSIGAPVLKNPAAINDYVQQVETYEGSGQYEDVRNTIVKIAPTLNGSGGVSVTLNQKTLVNSTDWVCENCTKNGEYITNVMDNAKIYIDNLAHAMYSDESGLVPADYRQRHWTKFRYVTSSFKVKNKNELFEMADLNLKLICKPYGEVSGKEWVFGRTGNINGLGVYDMFRSNISVDTTDEIISATSAEQFEMYDTTSAYRAETPSNSISYGPNLVGRIELNLEKGKVYQIGELKSYYTGTVEENTLDLCIRDEFQAPINCGCRIPGENPHPFSMNRYILGLIDGKRAFDIPQSNNTASDAYQVEDTWNFLTLNDLKGSDGNRLIYPRDDLGEVIFGVVNYTADSDGRYPITAMFNGQHAYIYWIDPTSKTSLALKPRFDSLSGTQLYRYVKQNNTIKCVMQFGAFCNGIVSKWHGSLTDSSSYPDVPDLFLDKTLATDYYNSAGHGTQTTVSLYDNIYRTLAKVVDGVKYNLSHFRPCGKILVNTIGKILSDNRGKIEDGGEAQSGN